MPPETSEFDDNAEDASGEGGVFANSDDDGLLFVVVWVCVAFTPKPEILVCGTSLGKGEAPFTPGELRKLAGDDDFPYDSDILFCAEEDIVIGFGDDENAAVAKPAELIFFQTFFPRAFFLLFGKRGAFQTPQNCQRRKETTVRFCVRITRDQDPRGNCSKDALSLVFKRRLVSRVRVRSFFFK